jgi:opacity protein-like surface antigen
MTSLGKTVIPACAPTALGARKSFSVLAVAAVAAAGLTAAGPASAAATRTAAHHHAAANSGRAGDETTASQNDLRDGWDPNEPALTQAAVGGGQFGEVAAFAAHCDHKPYAGYVAGVNTSTHATTLWTR